MHEAHINAPPSRLPPSPTRQRDHRGGRWEERRRGRRYSIGIEQCNVRCVGEVLRIELTCFAGVARHGSHPGDEITHTSCVDSALFQGWAGGFSTEVGKGWAGLCF